MMEYQRQLYRGSKATSAWLRTTGWVHVSATYVAAANQSTIDFNMLAWALPRGKSLLVSEPSLVLLSMPSQPQPVKVSSKPPKPAPTSSAPTTSAPAPTTDTGSLPDTTTAS